MTDGPALDADLLIAGGGPAGLATAIHAAGAGLHAIVVEPRESPIDKACGEGLMPGAVAALADLGVEPLGRAFHGIRYVEGEHRAEARFAAGEGRGVRRTDLHDALHRRAVEVGVRIEQGRIGEVRQGEGHVEAGGLRARYLVAADGLHSPTRGSLGLDPPPAKHPRFGVRRHLAVAPWTDLVEVHWTPTAEVYVTPVADDVVGFAVLGPKGTRLDDALGALPDLRDRIAGAEVASDDRGAGPLRQDVRTRVAGRVLLVGDAAGYVDAVTGEGLRLATLEAEAAVRAILREAPADYELDWREITAGYRRGTRALLAVARRPGLRRRLVPAAARFPALFGRCVDGVAGGR